ncbi:hypothetical protein [Pararhodonellum marinum]|uniref:hypothetical protein n=1 Tax=Pararhodonellum marinum TaxID=2755358 RepID=UPI001890AFF5|nr:hypothetical protein [Pararhodonellum marinum]
MRNYLFYVLVVVVGIGGCRTAYTDKRNEVYNAWERDVFDKYKPITEQKYQNQTLYLKDLLLVDHQENGFQPFAFRGLYTESFLQTVYSTFDGLNLSVELVPGGKNIFDPYIFFQYRGGVPKTWRLS